jgi:hypothetical protein
MTFPTLIFGFVLSTLYGALFHLWKGGSAGRLIFYLCLSWAGFFIGNFFAARFEWNFDMFGPIHIGMGTFGSILLLALGYWLSLVQVEKK